MIVPQKIFPKRHARKIQVNTWLFSLDIIQYNTVLYIALKHMANYSISFKPEIKIVPYSD